MSSSPVPVGSDFSQAASSVAALVRATLQLPWPSPVGDGVLSPTLTAALATVERFGPLTPSELAQREQVRRPTATRIVANLVELGLATRTPDPVDGRACLVATTVQGRALLKRLRKRKNAYLAKRMRDLDPDEVETLERAAGILERLLDDPRGRTS